MSGPAIWYAPSSDVFENRVTHYTVWVIDGAGTGVVEYDSTGVLTGRSVSNVTSQVGKISSMLFAHGFLWAVSNYSDQSSALSLVHRIDVDAGTSSVVTSRADSVSVTLSATPNHVLSVLDTNVGGVGDEGLARLVFIQPNGTVEAPVATTYSYTTNWLYADDTNAYVAGAGADSQFGWQTGGAYVCTVPLISRVPEIHSNSDINSPDVDYSYWAYDQYQGKLLVSAPGSDDGIYRDWETVNGTTFTPTASYEYDSLTANDPWVTCGETLLKFRVATGQMDVLRGTAAVPTSIPGAAMIAPSWDGDQAVWAVVYRSNYPSQSATLTKIKFDGTVQTTSLPLFNGFYCTPAIQTHTGLVAVPPNDVGNTYNTAAVRNLRIIRSRAVP